MADENNSALNACVQSPERNHRQRPKEKDKLYARHTPNAKCIGKNKSRRPYEFGVKFSLAVTHQHGLMVGARSIPSSTYDGHALPAQVEQSTTWLQDLGVMPTMTIVHRHHRGVNNELAPVEVIYRGEYKAPTPKQKTWSKRRQAIEPLIGHTEADHRIDRCWLNGGNGDFPHAVLCAAGFNIRYRLRTIAKMGTISPFVGPFGNGEPRHGHKVGARQGANPSSRLIDVPKNARRA